MSAGTVYTFCRYCSAACGIEVTVEGNRVAKISADKANPHSWQQPKSQRPQGNLA